MRALVAFLRFWYDFIVGDTWYLALGCAVAVGVTLLIGGGAGWVVLPLAVAGLLTGSIAHHVRTESPRP
jgi:hypothetical protein